MRVLWGQANQNSAHEHSFKPVTVPDMLGQQRVHLLAPPVQSRFQFVAERDLEGSGQPPRLSLLPTSMGATNRLPGHRPGAGTGEAESAPKPGGQLRAPPTLHFLVPRIGGPNWSCSLQREGRGMLPTGTG